jgi:acetyltransferase-like isoleucine patch superfamily enzyme
MGKPILNYRCSVRDEFLQSVIPGKEGELCVGGVGVFAGYLQRDDLTKKALTEIDGEMFYRTGDLVRIDHNGLLHYLGRKDHQIKLHGQRIELGEIERCLLNRSISNCVVMKWGEDHLVAYVQSSDVNENQLREHCQSHLPPHMIPSIFMLLDKLPLNANGKIDRKRLPLPRFSIVPETDETDTLLLTPLEEHLRLIFSEAFHNNSPQVNVSFGRMGGTSLDAIRALLLIRQQICAKIDAGILFANPSILELAEALKPLLAIDDDSSATTAALQEKVDEDQSMPSLCVEMLGILILVCLWILPMWVAYQFNSFLIILFVPIVHLLSYNVCQHVLFRFENIGNNVDKLYSWHYYRWWFLNRLWLINNSYWLKHLLGTPFYNSYLRLCGARIGCHTHIYTVLIDTPWLLEVGESSFIGEEVVLSGPSYQDRTYKLQRVSIGSHCFINRGCVLYEDVTIEDHTYVKPMSAITGFIPSSNDHISAKNLSLTLNKAIYQFTCLLCLFCIHGILLLGAYFIYQSCLTLSVPLTINLAISWTIWTFTSFFVLMFLLKFIVGSISPGEYSLNSHYYLHKLWLRQVVISSFQHSLVLIEPYSTFASIILRWLGASIANDVIMVDFRQILYFPSNLLDIEHSVTTFGEVNLAPFEMTKEGLCYIDTIQLGSGTNLSNRCTLMPGTRLSSMTLVGSSTLVTRKTVSVDFNGVFLGIPARKMPFVCLENLSATNVSSSDSLPIHSLLYTCFCFFMNKCICIALYLSLPIFLTPVAYAIIYCAVYPYIMATNEKRTQLTFSETVTHTRQCLRALMTNFSEFVGPYMSGTQYLVFFLRTLGAQIGCDVILSDYYYIVEPHLTTIGDHVRLNRGALVQVRYVLKYVVQLIVLFLFHVQCHTFERRLLKVAPVTVNHSSILMSNTLIFPGSILHGNNRILPLTLVMKNDQLPPNTTWSGVPAQQIE